MNHTGLFSYILTRNVKNKKMRCIPIAAALCLAAMFIFAVMSLTGCADKRQTAADSGTEEFVTAISPTNIGRLAPIAVSFACDVICEPEQALQFSPRQTGTWELQDSKTVVFTPSVPYSFGRKIILSADCAKLFGKDTAQGTYRHVFLADTPSYEVALDTLTLDQYEEAYSLSGSITTDIPVTADTIRHCVSAKAGGFFKRSCAIQWEQGSSGKVWKFFIQNISIKKRARSLSVSWQGRKLGLSKKQDAAFAGEKLFTIPPENEFSIIDINTSKKNTILVSFSRMLDTSQDIQDFISTHNEDGSRSDDVNVSARGNVLTIYDDSNWRNIRTIRISNGIKSSNGIYLAAARTITLSDNWELPSVRFMTDGTILPSSQGTVLPVETRNVSGLLIQAFAIYDHNIVQFLQVNELDGTDELYRVGEPVWTQNVSFDWDDSMQNKYIPRGIDVSALTKKYPHGMFQIRISFRKKNIKYRIPTDADEAFASLPQPPDIIEADLPPDEKSWWNYWEDLDYDERDTYWSNKNNPYHPAFYIPRFNSKNLIKRNILISDVGIMAKKTTSGKLYVSVADIKTAQPISGAEITCYSYVGSKNAELRSDKNGSAVLEDASKAVFIAASYKGQTSYLKIGAGTGLSVSHFETGGEKTVGGVKGFIYGERGVWRPGDPLYLTFVLQDLQKTLPADIPVSFELSDPLGRVTESRLLTHSVNGFYPVETKTAAGAVTGLWQAKVKIGGQEWTRPLRIETVVPNRLSVKLEPEKKMLTSGTNNFTLSGAWLHGAPAPNYNADVAVFFTSAPDNFGYSDFSFTNPSVEMELGRSTIWEGTLNSASKATFSEHFTIGADDPVPGKLQAHFVSRIFEPSGAFSTEQSAFPYSPYSRYVGLRLPKGDAARGMLLTDVQHTADVLLIDQDGKPVPSGELSYTIHKLDWKWWWEKDALTDATYVSSRSSSEIANGSVTVSNGKGSFQFEVKYPSWGRYLVTVSDGRRGHSAAKIVYIDWPGWAGRAQENGSGSAAMVTLVTDKRQYSTGETASISFASSAGNRALVTVEKNGEILKQDWLETAKDTTVYKLKLTEAMAPNVYVHITVLQQHLQTANSLPIRLYGIVPVMVDNPATKLTPVITAPAVYAPNEKAVISVSEQNGKPMTFTLAVVDEGLLGLTNYHGPELRREFYKKEASQLSSWDLYQYVMNAYSGKLETLLAIGGSEDLVDNRERGSNRFKPVVQYLGPFTIAAGEKKQLSFDMPEYVGAVRAIAVAGFNGAYGIAEKTVPVKADLMIQAALPRTLGVNERIDVPVTVFNGTDSAQNAKITLNTKGAIPSFNAEKTVKVPASSDMTVTFTVKTEAAGTADFTAAVKTDKGFAQSVTPVEVQARGIPVTYRTPFTLKPSEKTIVSVQSPGEVSSTTLSMELSSIPALNLASRLDYLIRYPHGCIEQITSGGFPQLYLADFVQLSPQEKTRIQKHIQSVIERYPQYQTALGAFAYWPGNSAPSAWGSSYALHFLTEAEKQGYAVPDSIKKPLTSWLASSAAEWESYSEDSAEIQAYRLFSLALAGSPNIGAMNRLKNERLDASAALLLAAAYSLTGRDDTAEDVFADALGALTKQETSYRYTGGSFGSSTRIQALYLMVCTLLKDDVKAAKAAREVASVLSSDDWCSTQETAWLLFSLLPYYKNRDAASCSYTVTANGAARQGQLKNASIIEALPAGTADKQTVEVTNTGKAILYGILTAEGMSIPGTEQRQNGNIDLDVRYTDSDGDRISPADLKVGDSFVIKISVDNRMAKKIENIALTFPIPTCWEISNDRIALDSSDGSDSFAYQDIRDDVVYTYFDLARRDSVTYKFYATVAYKGEYFIPAIHAQAMYDNSIRAVVPGLKVSF